MEIIGVVFCIIYLLIIVGIIANCALDKIGCGKLPKTIVTSLIATCCTFMLIFTVCKLNTDKDDTELSVVEQSDIYETQES